MLQIEDRLKGAVLGVRRSSMGRRTTDYAIFDPEERTPGETPQAFVVSTLGARGKWRTEVRTLDRESVVSAWDKILGRVTQLGTGTAL